MHRIDRLLTLIPQNTPVIADIGTDHGYLAIKALKRHHANMIYATDINSHALRQASVNLKRHHLNQSKQIKLLQSDGLTFLSNLPENKIDYVVIGGLGSKTISQIIAQPSPKIERYLILSNTEVSRLRQWSKLQNFCIEYEDFFYDNQRPYWLILINSRLKSQLKAHDFEFGEWKKWYQDNFAYRDYLSALHQHHLHYKGRITDILLKKKKQDYIERIEKYLKQWNY